MGLALIIVVLAKPLAWFYKEPQLEALLYAGSWQMVFTGLHSTSIFTLRRSLKLGWSTPSILIQTSVAIPLTILLAWLYPSPWAVVIGSLAGGSSTGRSPTFCRCRIEIGSSGTRPR